MNLELLLPHLVLVRHGFLPSIGDFGCSTRFECSSLYIRIIRTLCRPRYDTVFTQIPSVDIKDRKEEVRSKIEGLKGKLLIKYFPPKGVTVKKLQQHIEKMIMSWSRKQITNFDVIIVDCNGPFTFPFQ